MKLRIKTFADLLSKIGKVMRDENKPKGEKMSDQEGFTEPKTEIIRNETATTQTPPTGFDSGQTAPTGGAPGQPNPPGRPQPPGITMQQYREDIRKQSFKILGLQNKNARATSDAAKSSAYLGLGAPDGDTLEDWEAWADNVDRWASESRLAILARLDLQVAEARKMTQNLREIVNGAKQRQKIENPNR